MAMLRPSSRWTFRALTSIPNNVKPVSTTFSRGKATLPDLPCESSPAIPFPRALGISVIQDLWTQLSSHTDDYSALEPHISGKIMELHHSKHHNTYVVSYNAAVEKLYEAADSPVKQIELQPLINFHGGGHINHSLFWENLAPQSAGGGEPPKGKLGALIKDSYGSLENLQKIFQQKLAAIQGSGWAWLVKDKETGAIGVETYAVSSPLLAEK